MSEMEILQIDYQELLDSCDFSDVTFQVDGKEYHLHRSMMAGRSSVFKAMFKSALDESKQNRFELPDISAEVFQELLKYIYSGVVPTVEKYAMELFFISAKVMKISCLLNAK